MNTTEEIQLAHLQTITHWIIRLTSHIIVLVKIICSRPHKVIEIGVYHIIFQSYADE
jgi:hypothetical protein